MATNPKTQRSNHNACFVAISGGGKSQALKSVLPSRAVRCLLWDIDNDHAAYNTHYYADRKKYVRAVKSAIKSGAGFRIAWDGSNTVSDFEWWCSVVYAALDGNYVTYIVVEELADVSPSAGKATQYWGEVNRKCRKFGGRLLWTTQRSQEVSKTAYGQCETYYVGSQKRGSKIRHLADLVGVSEEAISALEPMQFYRSYRNDLELVTIKYVKSGEVKRG
jgi:hypothetical protein